MKRAQNTPTPELSNHTHISISSLRNSLYVGHNGIQIESLLRQGDFKFESRLNNFNKTLSQIGFIKKVEDVILWQTDPELNPPKHFTVFIYTHSVLCKNYVYVFLHAHTHTLRYIPQVKKQKPHNYWDIITTISVCFF